MDQIKRKKLGGSRVYGTGGKVAKRKKLRGSELYYTHPSFSIPTSIEMVRRAVPTMGRTRAEQNVMVFAEECWVFSSVKWL